MRMIMIGEALVNIDKINAITCESTDIFKYTIFIHIGTSKIATESFALDVHNNIDHQKTKKIEDIFYTISQSIKNVV